MPSKSWSLKPSLLQINSITIVALLNGSPKQLLASLFGGALSCSWHPFKVNRLSGDVYSARVRRSKTKKYEFENARISNAVFSKCDKLRKPSFPMDGHIYIYNVDAVVV